MTLYFTHEVKPLQNLLSSLLTTQIPYPNSSKQVLDFILIISTLNSFLISNLSPIHLQSKYLAEFAILYQTNSTSLSFVPKTQNHLDALIFFSNFSNYTPCKFEPNLPNLVKFISTLLQK